VAMFAGLALCVGSAFRVGRQPDDVTARASRATPVSSA
jgi:hypothetical protein